MPDNQRAIADTSVLIAFEKLNKLEKRGQIYFLHFKSAFTIRVAGQGPGDG
jgi:hypothetical protein